jgi:hypothetical protein
MSPPDERNGSPSQEGPASKVITHDDNLQYARCAATPPALQPASQPAKRRKPIDLMANGWTANQISQLVSGSWVPWAEWVDGAFNLLPGRRAFRENYDTVGKWHAIRDQALMTLSTLGLEATVTRTDHRDPVPLEGHFADLAGLVHVHREDWDYAFAPAIPSQTLVSTGSWEVHALRMLSTFRLVSVRDLVPTGLRAFCGQYDDAGGDLLGGAEWRDHLRVWTSVDGRPAMSVEPYNFTDNPSRLVEAIRATVANHALPLSVDGPYPGLWNERTVLAFIRHEGQGRCLPAVRQRALVGAV